MLMVISRGARPARARAPSSRDTELHTSPLPSSHRLLWFLGMISERGGLMMAILDHKRGVLRAQSLQLRQMPVRIQGESRSPVVHHRKTSPRSSKGSLRMGEMKALLFWIPTSRVRLLSSSCAMRRWAELICCSISSTSSWLSRISARVCAISMSVGR